MVLDSSLELIGNTPLVRLKNIERLHSLECKIYAKVEKGSLTGSKKDRAVLNMLIDYQERGIVKKGNWKRKGERSGFAALFILVC